MSDLALALKPKLPELRERVSNGEFASLIASELGISKQILSYHLNRDPEWKEAKVSGHETRMDFCHKDMQEAISARDFDLARAYEAKLKRLEWRAERECPDRWGQKNQSVSIVVQVSADELVGSAEDLLKSVVNRQQTQRTIESHATVCNEEDVTP